MQRAIEVLKMLCRWLAVLVLAGILLVIEAIAVGQGTLQTSRPKSPETVSETASNSVQRESRRHFEETYRALAGMLEITRSCETNLRN